MKSPLPKNISIRTLGLAMMTFIPGMGVGAAIAHDWLMGGLIAFGTSVATVVVYLGVVLTWAGKMTLHDVEDAFRTAANKAAENNQDIKKALDHQETDGETK
jgi:hypothetical protein